MPEIRTPAESTTAPIIVAATSDVRTAAALLRGSGRAVVGIDLRGLAGGARYGNVLGAADIYYGAVDAAMSRVPGLRAVGYQIRRAGS